MASQFIFENYPLTPLELVAIRMPLAGILLFLIFRPIPPLTGLLSFGLFSVIGLWLVQFTYFLTIDTSDAATATLFQFLALPMIAVYEIGASRTRATFAGVAAVLLASLGTAELAAGTSNGSLALIIAPVALIAGLVSAASAAYYTIRSKNLIPAYGSVKLTTWGLLIGSTVAVPAGALSSASRVSPGAGTVELVALVLFVVIFGTLTTFLLYFKGLERITPTEAGITSAMEPITAAVLSFFLLHVALSPFQYLGGFLIMAAVALIVLRSNSADRWKKEDAPYRRKNEGEIDRYGNN